MTNENSEVNCLGLEMDYEKEEVVEKPLKKCTLIEALRLLTGIFDPDRAVTILVFVNLIARKLDNDPILDDDFLLEQFKKIGIELVLT